MTLRELAGRLLAWRRKEELDEELTAALQDHLDLLARDFEREGLSPEDARLAARRTLGHVTVLKESSRDYWGFPFIERTLQDLRYALRGLRRTPVFTLAALLTLGLGIGANAAIFAVIDRMMIRPFPLMKDPTSVHRVYLQTTFEGRPTVTTTFGYARFLDLQRETHSFSESAAVSEWRVAVGRGDQSQVRKLAGVSAPFFGFFDAPPLRGRYFLAEEDALPTGTPVAVLSASYWRSAFGGADVVGQQLKVGALDYTIVGVAADGFVGAVVGQPPDIFVPITTIPANISPSEQNSFWMTYGWSWVEMLVRRRPGVSVEAANADLTTAHSRSRAAARALNPRVLPDSVARPIGIAGAVKTAAGPERGGDVTVLLWVAGVAIIVLLIACASVTNLMVARVLRRRREIAVRLALGVTRARLFAQFITESLVLSALALVVGLAFAQWSGTLIRRLLLPDGTAFNLAHDGRTLAVGLACVALCTALTAIAPVLIARREDLAATLRGGARDAAHRRSRLRTGLMTFQVALSVVLLIGAGLFVRSFAAARAVPMGFDVEPVVDVVVDLRGTVLTGPEKAALQQRLLATARALPGVEEAAAFNSRVFRTNTADLRVPGIDSVMALGRFNFQVATPEYFRVLRIAILRGRGLEPSDRLEGPPVTVVSEAMASVLWPGRDPIGQCLHIGLSANRSAAEAPCTTVVGVAQNIRQQNLADDPQFTYYLAAAQFLPDAVLSLAVRLRAPDPAPHLERVREALTRAMPGDGLVVVRPMQERVDSQCSAWRLGATLFGLFGVLALVVAAVGLYGVISYDVTGRAHELGVRAALGAQSANILWLVIAQALRVTAIGVGIGVLVARAASRWVEPLLFQVTAWDAVTYATVLGTMLVVALAASAVPAMRALRSDPMTALRAE